MTVLLSLGVFGLALIGLVFFIIILALVENEEGTWATIVILVASGLLYFTGGQQSFKDFIIFAGSHMVALIFAVIGYVAAGVAYSFWKWLIYVKERKEKGESIPTAKYHRGTLIRWIAYWIFSIWWTLLNEPLKALVEKLGKSYDKLAQKVYDKA